MDRTELQDRVIILRYHSARIESVFVRPFRIIYDDRLHGALYRFQLQSKVLSCTALKIEGPSDGTAGHGPESGVQSS
jgi:hypothetical protein